VIALGTNWPDALTASVLAARSSGPLLLTRRDSLPVDSRDELMRLSPRTVYVVGGTAAVSASVESDLRALMPLDTEIVRLGGTDRYDTAGLVARAVALTPGATGATVMVASGENYPDAMCATPVAGSAGWPILLTRTATLPQATSAAIDQLGSDHAIVVGGEAAVSATVASQLPAAERWAGINRYDTSRKVADEAQARGLLSSSALGFATGRAFPDALSAGPYASRSEQPVLLTDGMTDSLAQWLDGRSDSTVSITLYGGRFALPYDVEFDLLVGLRRP
jgi:lactocepin